VKRLIAALLLSGLSTLLTLSLAGCGSSSTPSIAIGLTSSSNGVDQAQTASITATVTNDSKSAGVQWSASGGGTLSGITTTSATYNAPASVTSAFTATITATSTTDSTKSASLQIKVSPLPTISTTSVPAATAGTSYSASLAVSGGTSPYKWTITSGTLPLGLTLSSGGIIGGIPTGAGSASVTFQVADATGVTASQAITITVNPPPPLTIATASLPGATLGTSYNLALLATGGVPSYIWTITAGSLPAGLTLSTTGVISGTPTGAGTSNFTVKVTDSQTPTPATKTANLSITVTIAPLVVTTVSLPGGSVGNVYSQTLHASGGVPPYTWSISVGTLPSGLTLNASTGIISGTPTATGTSTFTVKVTDSAATTATASLSIAINTALTFTATSLPGGSIGTAYSATLHASGGVTPYTWSISSGSLPAGLSLNATTGVISGTPTTIATSNFDVQVTDSESPSIAVVAIFSITIASASCPNNPTLSGHYAMLLNGWSGATTATAAIGSFVADGGGNISGGSADLNDQTNGPLSGTFTGTYCVASNNIATIDLTYGGGLSGANTFAAALNSSGSNGNIIFYDGTILKASGLLRKQDTSAFATSKITGNYAFGFVGATNGAARFALAGAISANGSANLSGEFDSDTYLTGTANATLSSSNFSVTSSGQSAGRGTSTITFTGQNNLKFVFYVVSATEMLAMEDDLAGGSLVAGQVLKQTGAFTNASLNGVGVSAVETLSLGTTPSVAAGLVTANGAGTIGWSTDQNQAGTVSSQSLSGSYSTSSNGRVTLALGGQSNPPVFYLIAPNQAFVVGTYSLAVDFGLIEPQSGSSFSNSSLSGAYLGGSMQPVSSTVGEDVDAAHLDGAGNFSRSSDSNGSGGTSTSTLTATYAISSNGRVVVSKSGAEIGIMYAISNSQFVFLPASASDTQPALSLFQQ
jgi:hypothetical protein